MPLNPHFHFLIQGLACGHEGKTGTDTFPRVCAWCLSHSDGDRHRLRRSQSPGQIKRHLALTRRRATQYKNEP